MTDAHAAPAAASTCLDQQRRADARGLGAQPLRRLVIPSPGSEYLGGLGPGLDVLAVDGIIHVHAVGGRPARVGKVDVVLVGIEAHVAPGPDLLRYDAADPLIGIGRPHCALGAVGEDLVQVDFDDRKRTAGPHESALLLCIALRAALSSGSCRLGARCRRRLEVRPSPARGGSQIAHDVKVHRLARNAQHAHVAFLGDLHDVTGRLVDGHGLPGHPIGTEDHPLAVGGPVGVRLVDLGIPCIRTGEKGEGCSGHRVDDKFLLRGKALADLGRAD